MKETIRKATAPSYSGDEIRGVIAVSFILVRHLISFIKRDKVGFGQSEEFQPEELEKTFVIESYGGSLIVGEENSAFSASSLKKKNSSINASSLQTHVSRCDNPTLSIVDLWTPLVLTNGNTSS